MTQAWLTLRDGLLGERAAPAGDEVASEARLRRLVGEHHDFIWRSLRRLGVGHGDVDDGVQQVFLVASRKLAEIRPHSERSFLYQTALRVAADRRKSQKRRREVPESEAAEEAFDVPTAEELVDLKRARRNLDEILDEMTLELRAVFTLFELDQLTLTEIAALLEVPRGTVASRLRRARQQFFELAERFVRAAGQEPIDE
jgi:RNA polymerase sigma-70 factor, ECF subfamily